MLVGIIVLPPPMIGVISPNTDLCGDAKKKGKAHLQKTNACQPCFRYHTGCKYKNNDSCERCIRLKKTCVKRKPHKRGRRRGSLNKKPRKTKRITLQHPNSHKNEMDVCSNLTTQIAAPAQTQIAAPTLAHVLNREVQKWIVKHVAPPPPLDSDEVDTERMCHSRGNKDVLADEWHRRSGSDNKNSKKPKQTTAQDPHFPQNEMDPMTDLTPTQTAAPTLASALLHVNTKASKTQKWIVKYVTPPLESYALATARI